MTAQTYVIKKEITLPVRWTIHIRNCDLNWCRMEICLSISNDFKWFNIIYILYLKGIDQIFIHDNYCYSLPDCSFRSGLPTSRHGNCGYSFTASSREPRYITTSSIIQAVAVISESTSVVWQVGEQGCETFPEAKGTIPFPSSLSLQLLQFPSPSKTIVLRSYCH